MAQDITEYITITRCINGFIVKEKNHNGFDGSLGNDGTTRVFSIAYEIKDFIGDLCNEMEQTYERKNKKD
jgi:hypothetical protein